MTQTNVIDLKQAEKAANSLNIAWVYYGGPEHGVMPHGMVKRRSPKTMAEVRQFGKADNSVFYFENWPDRNLEYAELLEYKSAVENKVAQIQQQERYKDVLKKVMAVLTDDEFDLLMRNYQPRG